MLVSSFSESLMRVMMLFFTLFISSCAYLQNFSTDGVEQMGDIITNTTNESTLESNEEDDSFNLIDSLRSRTDAKEGDPNWSPIIPQPSAEHYVQATGSLFNPDSLDFYQDIKPRRVGDIITVLLEESTQAQKNASNDTSKSSNLSLDPINVGGNAVTIQDNTLSYEISNDNQTSGSTSANQSNSISGSITVEVIEVLASGNLIIRGEKWLKINTGDEYIRLSGTIRPQDITKNNTIESTRISNAKIQYSATGSRQDIQEQSWLARFFNVIL